GSVPTAPGAWGGSHSRTERWMREERWWRPRRRAGRAARARRRGDSPGRRAGSPPGPGPPHPRRPPSSRHAVVVGAAAHRLHGGTEGWLPSGRPPHWNTAADTSGERASGAAVTRDTRTATPAAMSSGMAHATLPDAFLRRSA